MPQPNPTPLLLAPLPGQERAGTQMSRRQAHKAAHNPCPNGVYNWADCDAKAAHAWGPCRAVVGKHEPEPCSRWAVDDKGWCGQHYTALVEGERQAARIAIERASLDARISEYMDWVKDHPSVWDRKVDALAPTTQTGIVPRKGPHRVG